MNKRKSQSVKVLLVAVVLLGAAALFPPCETRNGLTAPREFLLFVGDNIQINAGRLLAEALLIVAIAGFALLYVWGEES